MNERAELTSADIKLWGVMGRAVAREARFTFEEKAVLWAILQSPAGRGAGRNNILKWTGLSYEDLRGILRALESAGVLEPQGQAAWCVSAMTHPDTWQLERRRGYRMGSR